MLLPPRHLPTQPLTPTSPPGFYSRPVLPFRTPSRFISYVRLLRTLLSLCFVSLRLVTVDVAGFHRECTRRRLKITPRKYFHPVYRRLYSLTITVTSSSGNFVIFPSNLRITHVPEYRPEETAFVWIARKPSLSQLNFPPPNASRRGASRVRIGTIKLRRSRKRRNCDPARETFSSRRLRSENRYSTQKPLAGMAQRLRARYFSTLKGLRE